MAVSKKSKTRKKRNPLCPECGSDGVLSIFYGLPNRTPKRALGRGKIVLADRQDWEGLPQWHCENCGCEWRGEWRTFKLRRV